MPLAYQMSIPEVALRRQFAQICENRPKPLTISKPNKHVAALRKIALSFPETVEGSSCNKLSYKAGKKAFLYLGEDDESYNLMVKLPDSYAEAEQRAKKDSEIYHPGSSGWVKCVFPASKAPPKGLLERWIEESFRALVPKKIVALLDE